MPTNRTLGYVWLVVMAFMIFTYGMTGDRWFLSIGLNGFVGFGIGYASSRWSNS